jgi:hypothetical protein
MDMIDNLIVEDSVYDEDHQGLVLKKRASLNKDYGRIGITINDERVFGKSGASGTPEYLEPDDDGMIPGLEGIPMFGG